MGGEDAWRGPGESGSNSEAVGGGGRYLVDGGHVDSAQWAR